MTRARQIALLVTLPASLALFTISVLNLLDVTEFRKLSALLGGVVVLSLAAVLKLSPDKNRDHSDSRP